MIQHCKLELGMKIWHFKLRISSLSHRVTLDMKPTEMTITEIKKNSVVAKEIGGDVVKTFCIFDYENLFYNIEDLAITRNKLITRHLELLERDYSSIKKSLTKRLIKL